jgi:hypothetical protein
MTEVPDPFNGRTGSRSGHPVTGRELSPVQLSPVRAVG